MNDRMRPISFGKLMDWILTEYEQNHTVFGVRKFFKADAGKTYELFGEKLETPFGPAAGPHTQLAQNIVAGYVAGSRFFELKTVQKLDGEDLPVAKPCITAGDECYNCEWSTELLVGQAYDEYIKGWFALKLLSRELGFGNPDGFIFNMSVGYDLDGIKLKKIDDYIEGMKNSESSDIWSECVNWAKSNLARFKNIDEKYVDAVSPEISNSITLSTLHGCPPQEIERIAAYLITEKRLNTFVKCNPTLLDYEYVRAALDALGFDYISFGDHHFKNDLQFKDAVPMLGRLMELGAKNGLDFGVKLTNTFPVKVAANELPSDEMYMSGRSLFPLSISLAAKLSQEFGGKLRISYSGGADIYNIAEIIGAGVFPVTVATTLLKPGGYNRLAQMADTLYSMDYKPFNCVNSDKLAALVDYSKHDAHYKKSVKPLPNRKLTSRVPLIDCFTAPCRTGCPIGQDIPAYMRLAGEGKHLEALRVITERNPLPFITGTICSHRCMDKCTRAFYEESVHIREMKLKTAENGFDALLKEIKTPETNGKKIAIVGGGPAGIAAAYFLLKSGFAVTIFEKRDSLGGIVKHVIPAFRISNDAIEKDIAMIKALGIETVLNSEITSINHFHEKGFDSIVIATGAWKPGILNLEYGDTMNVIDFLDGLKNNPEVLKLGKNVVVIGGGNTAMDAARAAKRVHAVEKVSLIYRRTKRYMPADEEELLLALDNGVEFCELLAPVGVKDGTLKCVKMELGAPDASGRRVPEATTQTVEIPADTVVSAVGELVDAQFFRENGIEVDAKGCVVFNADTLETNRKNVYIIGDAAHGPATVAEAIADAAKVAEAIAQSSFDKYESLNLNADPTIPLSKKGVLFPDIAKASEHERCLECSTVCGLCTDVCPNRANVVALINNRPQIVHVDYMCNECGNCETFCPYSSAPYKDKFTLFTSEEDFADSENEGFLILSVGKARVRLDGKPAEYNLDNCDLPDDILLLIRAVAERYAYLL